jgi:hypothetical protein
MIFDAHAAEWVLGFQRLLANGLHINVRIAPHKRACSQESIELRANSLSTFRLSFRFEARIGRDAGVLVTVGRID